MYSLRTHLQDEFISIQTRILHSERVEDALLEKDTIILAADVFNDRAKNLEIRVGYDGELTAGL